MIARLLAIYCMALAVVVGVNFAATPLYDDGSSGYPVWVVLDWFMAAGIPIALGAGLIWKLEAGDEAEGEAGLLRYLEANTLFYSALALALLFFSNWFASLTGAATEQPLVWVAVDTACAVVLGAAGWRLWRGADAA